MSLELTQREGLHQVKIWARHLRQSSATSRVAGSMGRQGELALLPERSLTLAACIREAGPELVTGPRAPSMLLLSSLSPLTLGEGGGVPACLPASLSNTNSSSVTRAVVT